MDTSADDYLWHCLEQYDRSIDEISRLLCDHKSFGPGCASVPFFEKCRIARLLGPSGERSDPGNLRLEYLRITERLESFVKNGQEYRDHLLKDLRRYAHEYHAATCFAHLGQRSRENQGENLPREVMAELTRELEAHYDLSGINALIAMLDDLNPAGVNDCGNPSCCTPEPPHQHSHSPANEEHAIVRKTTRPAHSE